MVDVSGVDRSIAWVKQTVTGADFNGALPTTTPFDDEDRPRFREYPVDGVGGVFDWGNENPVPHRDPELKKRGKTERRRVSYKVFHLSIHSAADFDMLVFITDGTTDTLLIDSNTLFGSTITDMVVTDEDLPEIPPGHWIKITTSGATADVTATVGALRALSGG